MLLYHLIRLMRPLQWTKNIFVFTGLIFSKSWDDPSLDLSVFLAALSFSLVSSAIYIINDIADCESDRRHPKKCKRPIAAGQVTINVALPFALGVGTAGLTLGYYISHAVFLIVLSYAIMNTLYSLYLKKIVLLDVFCIAAGFMLRILAGTVGVGIPPSNWLLLCGLMITLFLGFTKRRAELLALKQKEEGARSVLKQYSGIFLDELIAICASGTIITYSLYTMSPRTIAIHNTEKLIYTAPFVVYALFRYIYILHHANKAEDPAVDLFKDWHIVSAVLLWMVATFAIVSSA